MIKPIQGREIKTYVATRKCLDVRNTHATYESPMSYGKKVMCRESFSNAQSQSRSHAQNL